jgi:hypothetical protein
MNIKEECFGRVGEVERRGTAKGLSQNNKVRGEG